MPPLTLAIDTSTPWTYAALGRSLDQPFYESICREHNSHMEKLPLLVCSLLEENGFKFSDLGQLLLGSGPGSFTGLRIGFSYIKGLALALGLPVFCRPTLTTLYHEFKSEFALIGAALDARREEVFWSLRVKSAKQQIYEQVDQVSIVSSSQVQNRLQAALESHALRPDQGVLAQLALDGIKIPPGFELKQPQHIARSLLQELFLLIAQQETSGSTAPIMAQQVQDLALLEPLYLRRVAARTLAERTEAS